MMNKLQIGQTPFGQVSLYPAAAGSDTDLFPSKETGSPNSQRK